PARRASEGRQKTSLARRAGKNFPAGRLRPIQGDITYNKKRDFRACESTYRDLISDREELELQCPHPAAAERSSSLPSWRSSWGEGGFTSISPGNQTNPTTHPTRKRSLASRKR